MFLPKLPTTNTAREMVDVFKGYNHNLRIGAGEFFDMQNLTSDFYPVMSPRGNRGVYARPASPQGLIGKDQLCYVDGADFVVGQQRISLELSTAAADCPKQLISMGAYVIVMPDKKYVNTADLEDFGHIEAVVTVTAQVGEWSQATGFTALEAEGIGQGFRLGDVVCITGVPGLTGYLPLKAVGANLIVVQGKVTEATRTVTVERRMPDMDFVIESENRLWGCRYGGGVNDIYACKLGDFRNWNCFQGVSTDSYAASCGTDGPFTGAITHLGIPLFFKENCVHKVYGSYPSNYQIRTTACRGVQKGSHGSMAIVNETLYYKARSGVCAYDGSLPVEVSEAMGNTVYRSAVAGAHGSKYYISMRGGDGWHLFVYDTAKGLWHKEDGLQALDFCSFQGEMYCIDGKNRNIITLTGAGEAYEDSVSWMAQTGELVLSSPDMKYISRLTVRLSVEPGTVVEMFAQYDMSDEWIQLCHIRGTNLRSLDIPVRPRRCDHMKLKLTGRGGMKLYSITKTIEKGSGRS